MTRGARVVALGLASLAVACDGYAAGCGPGGIECHADFSPSLSMLQRTSEARGRKRRQEPGGEGELAQPADEEWHDDCAQAPTASQTLSNQTLGVLEQLNTVLEPFYLHQCFVTYIGEEADYYSRLASQPWVNNICEIGFNAGHSAVLLLSSNPKARLFEFDLGKMDYSAAATDFVRRTFGDRFSITFGNSTVTLPAFAEANPDMKCDLMIVDGGHQFGVSRADIANFQALANPSRHLLIVDDTRCTREICIGPERAWREAVGAGVVRQLERSGDDIQGWSLGNYTSVGKPWLQ